MRKYWYYTYFGTKCYGTGTCTNDNGEFDLVGVVSYLKSKGYSDAIVTFWKEISFEQYENFNEYFENREF